MRKIVPLLSEKTKKEADAFSNLVKSELIKWNAKVIDFYHPHYPSLLKEIYDPPANLFCIGNSEVLKGCHISVVGTRKPSPITIAASKILPKDLKACGYDGVVSGLAAGVDAAVMQAALESDLAVIGVMGTGPEMEYPPSNKLLYKKLKQGSKTAILTEYPPGFLVRKYAFPRRNRIITGISDRLLVLEAPEKSGALSSAANAIEQNREVYIFDHPDQISNAGGRKLLLDGANQFTFLESDFGTNIFHFNEQLPNEFEGVSRMLAQFSKMESDGSWKHLGQGFFRQTAPEPDR
ncbi:DNA-processing protein DprA [Leptospira perolatii]|uniref:DNA-processing protein DprA n=1 Tax=Leptospira perolatii TaxID=2023191 RepID=UPI001FAFFBCE|nr:DNA-processing protein DprA [Leptospira perolatii]